MNHIEIKNKNAAELQELLKENRVVLGKLRFDLADNSLKDVSRISKTKKEIAETLPLMKQKILEGKGDELLFGYSHFPMTAKRYLSLYEIGSKEDVFDYGDEKPKLIAFSNITKPLYVILGEKDEHADRPLIDIKKVFDAHTTSKNYTSIIVPNALHGFDGMEQKLAKLVGEWYYRLL